MKKPAILWQDADILLVCKPSGMPVSPDETKTPDLLTSIGDMIAGQGRANELFLIHRLDRVTGGVMALARTRRAASALGVIFAGHKINKEYLAVVEGETPDAGRIDSYLKKNTLLARATVASAPFAGASPASLSYRTLARREVGGRPCSLVSVSLDTGRFHQIRAQFSSVGHPLFGDAKYGALTRGDPALFACRLAFTHPFTGEKLAASAEPEGAPFDLFDTK